MPLSKLTLFLERNNVWMLRWAFAIVYVWFGTLKPLGISPAHDLVESTLGWMSFKTIVPVLGFWEIIIGLMFLVPRLTKITLVMFMIHMLGTFLPMCLVMSSTYTSWPYGLTITGQYIVKNLVFLAAGGALWVGYSRRVAGARRC